MQAFRITSRALLAALITGVLCVMATAPALAQNDATSGLQLVVKQVGTAPQAASLPKELLDRNWNLVSLQSRFQLSYNNGQGRLSYNAPTPQEQLCFAETPYCVSGRFLTYWRQNGGLIVFGLPISDQITENNLSVQYFERQRFELHAENAAPYDILLGRLGDELLRQRSIDWSTLPNVSGAQAGCRYFPETRHNVCDQLGGPGFLSYWSANGLEFDRMRGKSPAENLALFGLPLTEPMTMTLEGQPFLVQWFERARFEWHPDNTAAYRVLLSRLGVEVQSPPLDQTPVVPPAPSPADRTLTNSDNGMTIGLKIGQMLAVRLDSNPSTGYSWQVSQVDDAVLKQQGAPQFIQPPDAPPGAGGAQVFLFTAVAGGSTTLTLVYKRSFEPNVAPAQTFSVHVPGAGGQHTFQFVAAGAGRSTLTLVYKRSFEPNVAPVQTFSIHVTVDAGADHSGRRPDVGSSRDQI